MLHVFNHFEPVIEPVIVDRLLVFTQVSGLKK